MLKIRMLASLCTLLLASTAVAADLRVGVQSLPPSLDPGRDYGTGGMQIYYNAFDPLIEKNYSQSDGEYKPGIARAWTQTSPTVLDVKIRRDVKFHHGELLTVDDVVFTFDRILKDVTPEFAVVHRQFFENLAKVEAIDDDTVRFTSARPEPLFAALLNMQQSSIVPKKYTMGLSGDPNIAEPSDFQAFSLNPIGTGPYKIEQFIPGERLSYRRFEGFFGDRPPFENVVLRRISEISVRTTALQNKEVDLITNLPPDQLGPILSNSELKIEGAVTPLFHLVIFNTNNPILQDKRVRQALSLSVDRNLLSEALWSGMAVVSNTHTFPQYGGLYMPSLDTFEYDPDRARELLKEAGYDGSAIRYDTFSTYYTNGLLAAQAIKEMWAAVGVPMNINITERWNGGDKDLETRNWSNPMYFADPVGSFGAMWAPNSPGVEAFWSSTPTYQASWEKLRYSTSLEVRKQAFVEMISRVRDEAPFILLYQPYEAYGMVSELNWRPLAGHIPYVLDFRAGAVSMSHH